MPMSQNFGRKGLKEGGIVHHRDYPKYDLVFFSLFKKFHSLSFKAMFLRVYSQGPG